MNLRLSVALIIILVYLLSEAEVDAKKHHHRRPSCKTCSPSSQHHRRHGKEPEGRQKGQDKVQESSKKISEESDEKEAESTTTEPSVESKSKEDSSESKIETTKRPGNSTQQGRLFLSVGSATGVVTGPRGSQQQKKCDFVGNFAIKNNCVNYNLCPKQGQAPRQTYCPSGKNFDHKKRVCVKKSEAKCNSAEICPNDSRHYKMPDSSDGKWYLQCMDGVPMPTKCPGGKKYNSETKCGSGGAIKL